MSRETAQEAVDTASVALQPIAAQFSAAGTREQFAAAVRRRWGRTPTSLATPLFGLDAVLFHRGQAHQPHPRRQSLARTAHETEWEHVERAAPVLAGTCRRYLGQLALSLRPGSVDAIDITLRQFAAGCSATTTHPSHAWPRCGGDTSSSSRP